ncbi:helix-turn-helix domain-containing protein [Vibrio aerogenes]|uniref:helix-turn-helix domain-containing protein n=1 Tax=Vibrio aerogenes TaxID=92172 RepID=UPI0021C26E5F|nr:helix-turn-helix domain-containing protein [Vibrio aerogenes]
MPEFKHHQLTRSDIQTVYQNTGSLTAMAEVLNISYPTASAWAKRFGIRIKRRGYTPPHQPITGLQCRAAREFLKLTRDCFCAESGVSKTALRNFESGRSSVRDKTMKKIMGLFGRYGIEFVEDGTFKIGFYK